MSQTFQVRSTSVAMSVSLGFPSSGDGDYFSLKSTLVVNRVSGYSHSHELTFPRPGDASESPSRKGKGGPRSSAIEAV